MFKKNTFVIKQQSENNQIMLSHNFVQYSLELLNGICSLLLGSNYNSVISVYRTFYENYIVFDFLQNHTELTEAFIEHTKIDECILKMEFAKIKKTVSRTIPRMIISVMNLCTDVMKCYTKLITDNLYKVRSVIYVKEGC